MIGRPLSSIAFRQAIVTALVIVIAVALFAITALVAVQRSVRADLLHTIDTDIAGLVDVMVQGGLPELSRRIEDRTLVHSATGATAYYLLVDPAGRRRAGNLAAVPSVDPARSRAVSVDAANDRILVRATRMRGGWALFVGRSQWPEEALLAGLRRQFLWASLGIVAAALLVGIMAAWRLRARVAFFNHVFHRFDRGERDARVADAVSRDEFGTLGRHIDAHLHQIAQLLDIQREISTNIAHELRTPLAHLDTRLRRTLEQSEDPLLQNELACARADIRSIVSLFDALLDIALGQANSQLKPGGFDLSKLACDLADLYSASAEEAGLDFTTRIAPGIAMNGEPMQITRLIANLLDNAFKFVPQGGRIQLAIAEGPMIMVEDDGPGIPAEDRDLVFRRFGRSGARPIGHGLGLALVKVIATRHGMHVRFEDAHPGARFIVHREKQA